MGKTWWILGLLAGVFGLVGVGLLVGGLAAGGPWPVLVIGVIFLLIGIGLAIPVPVAKREQDVGPDEEMVEVLPLAVDPSTLPWTEEQLAGAIARAFAEAPYVVLHAPGRIRVRVDLADTRYLTLMGVRRVKSVFAHDLVVTGHAKAAAVDRTLGLTWSAGVDGSLRPRLTGSLSVFSGKAWGGSFRKELGVSTDGRVGAQVDWKFELDEVQEPTREVLGRAGWKRTWPAEARIALVIAAFGASAILVVPLAFLVVWLVG